MMIKMTRKELFEEMYRLQEKYDIELFEITVEGNDVVIAFEM